MTTAPPRSAPSAARVGSRSLGEGGESTPSAQAPIYNVGGLADDRPAVFGFNYLGTVVKITPSVRPTDYGISVDSGVISQGILVWGARVTLWGVPGPMGRTTRTVGGRWPAARSSRVQRRRRRRASRF